MCKELKETMHVHGKHLSQAPLLIYFNFFPKVFFPKFELPNSRCGLSASAAYTPVFTVRAQKQMIEKAVCKALLWLQTMHVTLTPAGTGIPAGNVMICYMKGYPDKTALYPSFTIWSAYVVEAVSLY